MTTRRNLLLELNKHVQGISTENHVSSGAVNRWSGKPERAGRSVGDALFVLRDLIGYFPIISIQEGTFKFENEKFKIVKDAHGFKVI